MASKRATTITVDPDSYRVEQCDEPTTLYHGEWFIVGGNRTMGPYYRHPYKSKASAQRALKRMNEDEQRQTCSMCKRRVSELRDADGCPIDSINCVSRHRFPSKELPEQSHRIETRNDLRTVYAAIDDPTKMVLDRQDLPVLGFAVHTMFKLIRPDGVGIFMDEYDILQLIQG